MSAPEYDDLDHTDLDVLQDGDEVTVRDKHDDEWTAVLRDGTWGMLFAHGYVIRHSNGEPGRVAVLSARRPRPPMEPLPDVPCVLIATVRGVADVVMRWRGDCGVTAELVDNARWHGAKEITAWRHLTDADLPRLRGEDR